MIIILCKVFLYCTCFYIVNMYVPMVWYTRLDICCNDCDSNYSRPRSVDDVAHQEEVVGVLKKSLEGSDVSAYLPTFSMVVGGGGS